MGAGRQRLSQAGEEVRGSGTAVLREAGSRWPTAKRDVPGLCQLRWGGHWWTSWLYLPESLDLGQSGRCSRQACCGCAGSDRQPLPVQDGVGLGDGGAGLGKGPPEGRMGRGGRRLPDPYAFAVMSRPERPGGLGDVVRAWTFRKDGLHGVAVRSRPGPVRPIRDSGGPANPTLVRRSAPDHGAAQRRVAGGLPGVRSHGGRGKPGSPQLPPLQRQRVRPTSRSGSPAKSTGPSTAGTWTAANPATTCPMLRRIPLGDAGIRVRLPVGV